MANSDIPPISDRVLSMARSIADHRMAFLSSRGLSAGHDAYLLAIYRNPAITMGDLSDLLGISPSSATKIATRLQAMGLLTRENSRLDSRQYHAHLTESGSTLAAEIDAAQQALDSELNARLKAKDGDRLLRILDRLEEREPIGKKPRKAGKKKPADPKEPKKRKKKGK